MVKKVLIGFVVSAIVLLLVGVFVTAATLEIDPVLSSEIDSVVSSVTDPPELVDSVQAYIEKFVLKRGIGPDAISNINELDFNALPKEINIENINDANLAIYEVNYDDGKAEKVFVVTYAVEELRAQGDLIIAHDKRQFLNFGFDGEMSNGFLETATGVEGSLEKGYVMVRPGSITAMSTNLEVVQGGQEQIEILIYKNGEQIGFGNSLNADVGIQEDYDVQSNGVVTFEPGDVISVYVNGAENYVWKDVITMIEITTTN